MQIICIFFEKEGIDTSEPRNELLFHLMATIAEEESNSIGRNLMTAHEMRNRRGTPFWQRKYGYKKGADGEWVPDERPAAKVRSAFCMACAGYSVGSIRRMLIRMEEADPSGKKWRRTDVSMLLRNVLYKGDYLTQKTIRNADGTGRTKNRGEREQYYLEEHHTPLIPPEVFDHVQKLLESTALWENRRFVLFGYRLDEDGEYRIVGEEAAVVREAFTLYEHGYSHKQIANAFNQKGYKSPTGLRWQETTIHRMLDNEKYVGDVMMQKRVTLDPLTHREVKNDQTVYPSYYVQDHHAAIIDRAQYNRVRKIRAMCNSKLGPLQYPYDDKLVCPICGQRLIQRRSDVLDNKSAWHCERNERSCERYVLNSVIVNEAVLNACKALNRDEIQVVISDLL